MNNKEIKRWTEQKKLLEAHNLTTEEYVVLCLIKLRKAPLLSELARDLTLPLYKISRLLSKLAGKGLITKERERIALKVRLTPRGLKCLEQ